MSSINEYPEDGFEFNMQSALIQFVCGYPTMLS